MLAASPVPSPAANVAPRFLTVTDAARYLGLSKSYLDKARVERRGPTPTYFGTAVRYAVDDLDIWANQFRRPHTA